MKILFCGDVVGRTGRKVIVENLAEIRRRLDLDFVVVNGENAAHGFGITEKICKELYDAGADVITTGNHVWDRREIIDTIDNDQRLLRPLNYPAHTPGKGSGVFTTAKNQKVMVLQIMGSLFMSPVDDPFIAAEKALKKIRMGHGEEDVDAIIVDIHAEATSEKMAVGHVLDGRVSLVVGTHSHVPTADTRILAGGTAYQTDAGMCGDYDSVIGMEKSAAISRFIDKENKRRLSPALGDASLCAVYVETDDQTGLASKVSPLRFGGCLSPVQPA
jgi:2',3'-cyclic-nucleotide 2'-phosphodiesterase